MNLIRFGKRLSHNKTWEKGSAVNSFRMHGAFITRDETTTFRVNMVKNATFR